MTKNTWTGGPLDPNAPDDVAQNAAQSATQARSEERSAHGLSGWIAALVSLIALLFSAYSLWETSLKQPDLQLYASPVVHYTRDGEDAEVFAVPITISNSGARDGAVLSLDLRVKANAGGLEREFYSAYWVDGSFFVPPGRFDPNTRSFERVDRPKTPFAPIAVPGRGTYTGTILFYNKGSAWPKLVADKGTFELTLEPSVRVDESLGIIDRVFKPRREPVTFTVRLPWFSDSEVKRGGTFRMVSASWGGKPENDANKAGGDGASGKP
ncbi:MAG: hypothetical protein KDJ47_16515 [Hyphomicrobiaceae bacterium]|nr:hypothetical protein [Hyphomicrobiaceae bacterium]